MMDVEEGWRSIFGVLPWDSLNQLTHHTRVLTPSHTVQGMYYHTLPHNPRHGRQSHTYHTWITTTYYTNTTNQSA